MAETKPKTDARPTFVSEHIDTVDEAKANEVGAADVQKQTDTAEAQGFIGVKTDPRPNSDYSLEGGPPTAPTHADPKN